MDDDNDDVDVDNVEVDIVEVEDMEVEGDRDPPDADLDLALDPGADSEIDQEAYQSLLLLPPPGDSGAFLSANLVDFRRAGLSLTMIIRESNFQF